MSDNLLRELPMGFGMALAQNERALEAFSALDEVGKRRVIEGTHQVSSQSEMQAYVERLAGTGRGIRTS